MMKFIFKKSHWMISLTTGVLFALFAASPVFADYSGRVASFKSEKNAVIFVHKMKARGLVAYYQKEDVPGKGEFFRTYIGGYKTLPLAQKALIQLKKSGVIESFKIQWTAEKSGELATSKPEFIEQKSEHAQKPENKMEAAAQTNEPAQKPESKIESAAQTNEPTQKSENKTEVSAQTNKPAQKSESKIEAAAQTNEPIQKSENKTEVSAQTNGSAQKPESKIESVAQTNEPNQKPEKKIELVAQKHESVQKPENKTTPSIDTRHYYDGVKGIVLKNGRIIKGRILSIDDNDVLKIRTRGGRILSYSFTGDVKEYITEP
ncbi:MAG: SPOR domain-containing protein [Smithella sp.]